MWMVVLWVRLMCVKVDLGVSRFFGFDIIELYVLRVIVVGLVCVKDLSGFVCMIIVVILLIVVVFLVVILMLLDVVFWCSRVSCIFICCFFLFYLVVGYLVVGGCFCLLCVR